VSIAAGKTDTSPQTLVQDGRTNAIEDPSLRWHVAAKRLAIRVLRDGLHSTQT
jgi:hypothetical protein